MNRMSGFFVCVLICINARAHAQTHAGGGILVHLRFQEVKQGEPWYKAAMMSCDQKSAPTEASAELIRNLLRIEGCGAKPEAPTTYRITPAAPDAAGPLCEIGLSGIEGLKGEPNCTEINFRGYSWNAISYELKFRKQPSRPEMDRISRAVADFAALQSSLDVPINVQMTIEHSNVPNSVQITIRFPREGVDVPPLEELPVPKTEKNEKGDRST